MVRHLYKKVLEETDFASGKYGFLSAIGLRVECAPDYGTPR